MVKSFFLSISISDQRKILTPFKSTEARVVGGRKVVERRGLSIKIEIMIKEIVLSSSFKLQTLAPLHTTYMLRICSGLFNGTRPKRRIHIELSLFEKNCKIALQSLFLGLALQWVCGAVHKFHFDQHSPDFLSKKEVGEARHMGPRPVLLLRHQHQPQHPVHPLQLRHLGYFPVSCSPKWSNDLFEKDKVASNPVCIVELPAAEHWAHACLLIKVEINFWPSLRSTVDQVWDQLLIKFEINCWSTADQGWDPTAAKNCEQSATSCLKSTERRGVLVTKSMILKVLLYALKAAILKGKF